MLDSRRIVFATLLSGAAFACLGIETESDPSSSAVQQTAQEEPTMPKRVSTGTDASGSSSVPRTLEQSMPWNGARPIPFSLESDRDAARAKSLEHRAWRRSFEGAPPVMPHSASFGEGTKDCLDCHTTGMTIGDRVAYPMSHAPLVGCTQCHIESTNRELPPPAVTIANSFEGMRPSVERASVPHGMPRPIPHSIKMRNRCLACHGEFGYPGLRTSHPERALCVQCHLPSSEGP